jgi:uncharacterized membrane protein
MAGIAAALHALAATLWVGGMLFAYSFLRPSLGPLGPAERLPLWRRVLGSFLPAVAAAVAILIVTGYLLLLGHFGGFRYAGLHVHLMHLTGWLMVLLFAWLLVGPWRRFRTAVDAGRLEAAAPELDRIRRIVATNLGLGLLTVALGAGGRFLA